MTEVPSDTKFHERKKHPKKICIKNFGGTLAGGSRRGFSRPNSLCRCWFSQQNTVHKEFRGGGLRGSWGWGLRSNFGAPFLYVYVLFWGLKVIMEIITGELPSVYTEQMDAEGLGCKLRLQTAADPLW